LHKSQQTAKAFRGGRQAGFKLVTYKQSTPDSAVKGLFHAALLALSVNDAMLQHSR